MGLRAVNNPAASFEDPYASTGTEAYKAAITETTGGTQIDQPSSEYRYHVFTSPGVMEFAGAKSGAQVLIIGGGASGGKGTVGSGCGGGGGAGGIRLLWDQTLSGSYAVTVGDGGVVRTGGDPHPYAPDYNGSTSTFDPTNSGWGGGAGGGQDWKPATGPGPLNRTGGSGGGGIDNNPGSAGQTETGTTTTDPTIIGNPGGLGYGSGVQRAGGGGGGAGAKGFTGTTPGGPTVINSGGAGGTG